MSIKIMTLVWDAFPVQGSELLCMLAMSDWANDQGGSLHPSMRAVAEKIRTSEKQARRIVQKLVDDGYLSVVGNAYGGAPGTTKQWLINIKKLKELVAQKEANEAATPPMDGSGTAPTSVTPPMGETPPTGVPDPSHGCPETAPTGVPDASHPWEPNHHRTVNRTTIEPSGKRAGAQPAPERPTDVDPQVWADWLQLRKAKRAPVTQTVLDAARVESGKAGMPLDAFLREWCARGSQGLQAEWLKPPGRQRPAAARQPEHKHAAASRTIFDGVFDE